MKKLIELPIYAMSTKVLCKKVEKWKSQNMVKVEKKCADIEIFPQRSTIYNHIVGYLIIEYDEKDIWFKLLLPYKLKKYYWKSKTKVLMYDVLLNGKHFNHKKLSNLEIKNNIMIIFDSIIKEIRKYEIDYEYFHNILKALDLNILLNN